MRAFGQKLVKFCTHTRAAKLVVEIIVKTPLGSKSAEAWLKGVPKQNHES